MPYRGVGVPDELSRQMLLLHFAMQTVFKAEALGMALQKLWAAACEEPTLSGGGKKMWLLNSGDISFSVKCGALAS